jgi:nucleotide-binding universal stress UspA family protein
VEAYRRIVVGIDLVGDKPTDGSVRALEAARAVRGAGAATCVLVHATGNDVHMERVGSTKLLRSAEGSAPGAAQQLEHLSHAIGAGWCIAAGRPAEALCRVAARERADLVVIGKRSHADVHIDGQSLGVGVELAKASPCDVWTVRPAGRAVPHRILAATDASVPLGQVVVTRAALLAGALGAELHLLHACELGWTAFLGTTVDRQTELARRAREARAFMDRELARAGAVATLHTPTSAPEHAIADLADSLDADLVVLGAHARGGITGALLGNVTLHLLSSLDRSLCVVTASCAASLTAPAHRRGA